MNDSSDHEDVQLYHPVAEVNSLSSTGSKVVGTYGTGGIGKTIIAKALYDRIRCQHYGGSIDDSLELEEQLLRDIMLETQMNMRYINRVLNMIKNQRRFMRDLLLLYDVDCLNQLEALIRKLELVGYGRSLELFSCEACRKNQPFQGPARLTKSVARYAKVVLFALKILGSFLFGKYTIGLKSASCRLQERSNMGSQGEFQEAKIEDACGSYPGFGDGVVEDEFVWTTMYDNIREMHDRIRDSVLQTVDGGTPEEPGRSSKL